MKIIVQTGRTSKRDRIFIGDATVTTGAGKTGLTNSSCTAYYFRDGDTSATVISLSAGTVGTWSSGGFKEIDSTNMPGWYEVGIPNAVFANTVDSAEVMFKGTNLVPVNLEYQLVPWNPQDAVRLGLTALPNVAAGAAGGILTDTNSSGQLQGVHGNVTGTVGAAASVTGSVGSVTGAVGSVTGAVGSVTGAVGSVTGAVGSVTAGVTVTTNNDKSGYALAGPVTVGTNNDKTGYSLAGPVTVSGPVTVDMTQAVPTSNTPQTVGDALNAARAQGFGAWVISGTSLVLYASDGFTVVRTFTLNNSTAPTQRT